MPWPFSLDPGSHRIKAHQTNGHQHPSDKPGRSARFDIACRVVQQRPPQARLGVLERQERVGLPAKGRNHHPRRRIRGSVQAGKLEEHGDGEGDLQVRHWYWGICGEVDGQTRPAVAARPQRVGRVPPLRAALVEQPGVVPEARDGIHQVLDVQQDLILGCGAQRLTAQIGTAEHAAATYLPRRNEDGSAADQSL